MVEKTIIVFSPHPDDETLGVGGTIAKEAKKGQRILVVIMTDGRHAFTTMGIDSDPSPEELKEIRKKELTKALEMLGVNEENLFFLNFEDGTLEHNESLAEEKTITVLAKNPPSEVYFTYAKDAHADHRATNRIVRKAIKKSGFAPIKYQYCICRPHSRIVRLMDSFANFFRYNMLRVDVSEFVDLKKAAINEFKSQTAIISVKQENPIFSPIGLGNFLGNYETFYKDK